MTVSIRLRPNEDATFKAYAKMHGISVSEAFRRALAEKIEDEYDLKLYEEGMAAYKADPTTYTLDEVKEMLDIK